MAHKTLISGTAYSVTGGRELIGGTGYDCKAGKTLIGGTAFDVPFSKGIPLRTITPGAILYLNESGSPVPFYIAKHDYESGLNGAGRTLVVRKDCYDMRAFSYINNAYASSDLDAWLCSTYLQMLTSKTQALIGKTKFYYTVSGLSPTLTTLQRAVFQLSIAELGETSQYANTEGSALSIASTLRIAHLNGTAGVQWTRTPCKDKDYNVFTFSSDGRSSYSTSCGQNFGSRPAFTIPATLAVIANPDGTYTLAA